MFNGKNIFFYFCLIPVCIVCGVDLDYINGNALRSKKKVCYNDLYNFYCKLKCASAIGLCIGKQCYCVSSSKNNEDHSDPQMIYYAKPGGPFKESVLNLDDSQYYEKNVNLEQMEDQPEPHSLEESMALRPTLRHHIAHFCPNLDVARQCIRTCMKVGKPAFCGKDHVCYCGHKYKSTDDTNGDNEEDTYGQFRDLYEKYFGSRKFVENEH